MGQRRVHVGLRAVHSIVPGEFRRVTDVSYLGFVYGTHAALRRMLPRNHGTIVQVGSALAYRVIPLQSAYCGAKQSSTRPTTRGAASTGSAGRRWPRLPRMPSPPAHSTVTWRARATHRSRRTIRAIRVNQRIHDSRSIAAAAG